MPRKAAETHVCAEKCAARRCRVRLSPAVSMSWRLPTHNKALSTRRSSDESGSARSAPSAGSGSARSVSPHAAAPSKGFVDELPPVTRRTVARTIAVTASEVPHPCVQTVCQSVSLTFASSTLCVHPQVAAISQAPKATPQSLARSAQESWPAAPEVPLEIKASNIVTSRRMSDVEAELCLVAYEHEHGVKELLDPLVTALTPENVSKLGLPASVVDRIRAWHGERLDVRAGHARRRWARGRRRHRVGPRRGCGR